MVLVVADASVLVKLFLKEEYSENAYSLRDSFIVKEIDIIVPSITHYEVMNALKYSNSFNKEELEKIASTLVHYKFGTVTFESDFAKMIVDFSMKYNISMYDASYVALASISNSVLYTADDKLIKATKLAFIQHIKKFKEI